MILGRRLFLCAGSRVFAACGSSGRKAAAVRTAVDCDGRHRRRVLPVRRRHREGADRALPNTQVTAEVTAASVDNLKFIKQGNSDLAFTMADIAADARRRRVTSSRTSGGAVRLIAVLYPSYTHLVTLATAASPRWRICRARWSPPARRAPARPCWRNAFSRRPASIR
jgi:hypothetical protein